SSNEKGDHRKEGSVMRRIPSGKSAINPGAHAELRAAERHKRRHLSLLLVGMLVLIPARRALANCDATIVHGFTNSFEQCGPNAAALAWFHGRAVQRIIQNSNNGAAAGVWGHDSGHLQTLAESMMIEGPNGAANGSYDGDTDFNNFGFDGCIKSTTDGACK